MGEPAVVSKNANAEQSRRYADVLGIPLSGRASISIKSQKVTGSGPSLAQSLNDFNDGYQRVMYRGRVMGYVGNRGQILEADRSSGSVQPGRVLSGPDNRFRGRNLGTSLRTQGDRYAARQVRRSRRR